MRARIMASVLCAIGVAAVNTHALADEHDNHRDNHQYVRHDEWRKGAKIHDEDWQRGEHVEYREHHLRAPPHGYEWRMIDGNYVLAAAATGVIVSVVAAPAVEH